MNIILFTQEEIAIPLSLRDERAHHIIRILKLKEGDRFLAGIMNGDPGWARITLIQNNDLFFEFQADPSAAEHCRQYPVTLIVGHPRPPVARRILKDAATMGIQNIFMPGTDLGEKSYVQSKLWREDLYKGALIEGAQQGRTTLLPEARPFYTLKTALNEVDQNAYCIALDHLEPEGGLAVADIPKDRSLALAVGPERGWTMSERSLLKQKGFHLYSIGPRVLRTETACSAGIVMMMCTAGIWI